MLLPKDTQPQGAGNTSTLSVFPSRQIASDKALGGLPNKQIAYRCISANQPIEMHERYPTVTETGAKVSGILGERRINSRDPARAGRKARAAGTLMKGNNRGRAKQSMRLYIRARA